MAAYYDEAWKQWRYRRKGIILPNGKRGSVSGTPAINTKNAAMDAEREHINRLLHPERVTSNPDPKPATSSRGAGLTEPTIAQLGQHTIDTYGKDGKPTARSSRNRIIQRALIPFFGPLHASQLDQTHIEAFVEVCLKAGNEKRTINNKLTALSVVLDYAVECRKIAKRPELRLHRKEPKRKNEVQPYTRDEIAALLKACDDKRYTAAILLGCDAGLRIGEIRGLQWTDINWKRGQHGTLTIRRSVDDENNMTGPKNGNDREIPISKPLRKELETLPKRGVWVLTRLDDDAAFLKGNARKLASPPGGFLGYTGMLRKMKRIVKASGIEEANRSPWHSLRHTFGTELAALGVTEKLIAELMDHADTSTTRRYIKITDQAKAEAIDRAFNR